MKEKAGIDVREGKIHRVIEGREIWECDPALKGDYKKIYNRARSKLQRDKNLRLRIEELVGVPVKQLQATLAIQLLWLNV